MAEADFPLVSVIIIVYNDAALISKSLKSALNQSMRNIEIIVVDHGSTDSTAEQVKRYLEIDSRVKLIQLPDNEGQPGRPLNAGIKAARGDWITFMGSDDELAPDACELLYNAGVQSDVDLVLGKVARKSDSEESRERIWKRKLYQTSRRLASALDDLDLIEDTISAGKLYRLEMLQEHGIVFPEDILYEDQLFTMNVYIRAVGIIVIQDIVYYWYSRPDAIRKSITNSRHELQNFRDRIEVNKRIDRLIDSEGCQKLKKHKAEKFIRHDFKLYFDNFAAADEQYQSKFMSIAREYLGPLLKTQQDGLPVMLRVVTALLAMNHPQEAITAYLYSKGKIPLPVVPVKATGRSYWLSTDELQSEGIHSSWADITRLGLEELPIRRKTVGVESAIINRQLSSTLVRITISDRSGSFRYPSRDASIVVRSRDKKHEIDLSCTVESNAESDLVVELPLDNFREHRNLINKANIWDFWIIVSVNGSVKMIRVPFPAKAMDGGAKALGSNVSATLYSTSHGNLSMRRMNVSNGQSALVQLYSNVYSKVRSASSRRLTSIGHRVSRVWLRLRTDEGMPTRRGRSMMRHSSIVYISHDGKDFSGGPRRVSSNLAELGLSVPQVKLEQQPVKGKSRESPDIVALDLRACGGRAVFGSASMLVTDTRTISSGCWPVRNSADAVIFWDGDIYDESWLAHPNSTVFTPGLDVGRLWARPNLRTAVFDPSWMWSIGNVTSNERLRKRLDLPLKKKMILFKPGKRNGSAVSADLANPDFHRLEATLSEEWFVANSKDFSNKPMRVPHDLSHFVFDLTKDSAIERLFENADCQVTDDALRIVAGITMDVPTIMFLTDSNIALVGEDPVLAYLIDHKVAPVARNESDLIQCINDLGSLWAMTQQNRETIIQDLGHDVSFIDPSSWILNILESRALLPDYKIAK